MVVWVFTHWWFLLLLLLFDSLSFSFRLSVFCINCILRARSTMMHVYVSQADSSNVVPLQWFYFFIPNAFEIIAEEAPQFFSRAMNTIFYSHYKSIGWMLLLLSFFRITLYKQLIWFKATAPRLLFKKNVGNSLVLWCLEFKTDHTRRDFKHMRCTEGIIELQLLPDRNPWKAKPCQKLHLTLRSFGSNNQCYCFKHSKHGER